MDGGETGVETHGGENPLARENRVTGRLFSARRGKPAATDWNEAIRELPYVMPAVSESSKRGGLRTHVCTNASLAIW